MLSIVCWLWKSDKSAKKSIGYTSDHVNALSRMLKDHMSIPFELVCITDLAGLKVECETFPLWDLDITPQKCFRRLRLFDPEIASQFGDRLMSIDLDVVIEDDLAPLIDENESFQGIRGDASPINGSFWTFKAGTNADVWEDFDPSPKGSIKLIRKCGYHGSDQAWLSMKFKDAPAWTGHDHGVWTYKRMRKMNIFPEGRRITAFPGGTKPWENAMAAYSFQQLHKAYVKYL